ncbi:hypothetical protein NW759_013474 [Fusarium solani]|nr:hypothetical protein NW759_013474 [Fusarium solani]
MAPSKNNSRKAKAASKASSASTRVLRPRAVPAPASPSPAPGQSSSPSTTSPSAGPPSAKPLKTRSRPATTVETPSKAAETEPSTTTRVLRSRATLASSSSSPAAKTGKSTLPVPVSDVSSSSRRPKRARVASPSPVRPLVLDRHGKRPRVDSDSEFEDEDEDGEDNWVDEADLAEDLQDAIVDADGLVRVGPQPMKPQRFVRSAPRNKVIERRKYAEQTGFEGP